MLRRQQRDERVFPNGGMLECGEWDYRIVLRRDNQGGAPNVSDDPVGARLRIIIGCIAETAEARRDCFVEAAHRTDMPHPTRLVAMRIHFRLVTHAALHPPDETVLVEEIRGLLERGRAAGQIHGGSHGGKSPQFRGCGVTKFPGHLQYEVAAHRKARGKYVAKAIPFDQFENNRADVTAQTRVIKSFGEVFGVAAISLIQPHHIEARHPGFLGGAEHVARFARSLEAVKQDESRVFLGLRLPMTFAPDFCARLYVELPGYAGGQPGKAASPEGASDGHQVTVAQMLRRCEVFHHNPC